MAASTPLVIAEKKMSKAWRITITTVLGFLFIGILSIWGYAARSIHEQQHVALYRGDTQLHITTEWSEEVLVMSNENYDGQVMDPETVPEPRYDVWVNEGYPEGRGRIYQFPEEKKITNTIHTLKFRLRPGQEWDHGIFAYRITKK